MYITIYFLIGFIAFCVFQVRSRGSYEGGRDYDVYKGFAWASLFFWPLVIIFFCVALISLIIVKSIELADRCIDRIIRRKK